MIIPFASGDSTTLSDTDLSVFQLNPISRHSPIKKCFIALVSYRILCFKTSTIRDLVSYKMFLNNTPYYSTLNKQTSE